MLAMMQKRILIIDDDEKLGELLKEYLSGYDFQVSGILDGLHAMEAIANNPPDIIILDIMMPGMDGLEVLKLIRTKYTTPVIMLTARGEDTDRIIGLELGADDYLSKPFNPRELLARIKAVLRRFEIPAPKVSSENVSLSGLELDRARQRLTYKGRQSELSTAEFRLIEVFMEHEGAVLSRDELMNMSRGRDFMAFDRSIDVHVSKLRTKLEDLTGSREWIQTYWGSGYMFTGVL